MVIVPAEVGEVSEEAGVTEVVEVDTVPVVMIMREAWGATQVMVATRSSGMYREVEVGEEVAMTAAIQVVLATEVGEEVIREEEVATMMGVTTWVEAAIQVEEEEEEEVSEEGEVVYKNTQMIFQEGEAHQGEEGATPPPLTSHQGGSGVCLQSEESEEV